MRSFTNFLAGALCGALVGAVTALLLAPTSGEELQTRIGDQMKSMSDEIRAAYENRVAQMEAELASLKKPAISEEE
jgi:gas vesicle protein